MKELIGFLVVLISLIAVVIIPSCTKIEEIVETAGEQTLETLDTTQEWIMRQVDKVGWSYYYDEVHQVGIWFYSGRIAVLPAGQIQNDRQPMGTLWKAIER